MCVRVIEKNFSRNNNESKGYKHKAVRNNNAPLLVYGLIFETSNEFYRTNWAAFVNRWPVNQQ